MTEAQTPRRYPPTAKSFLQVPHLRVSETRVTEVPAEHGIAAHRNYEVTTACGMEIATTLVTKDRERTRCQACYDASAPA